MKSKNLEMVVWEKEKLWNLLEYLMERIQNAREEMALFSKSSRLTCTFS